MQPLISSPQNVKLGIVALIMLMLPVIIQKVVWKGLIQEFVGKGASEIWAITKIEGLRPKPGGIIEHFTKGIGNSQAFQCVNEIYEFNNKVQTMISV